MRFGKKPEENPYWTTRYRSVFAWFPVRVKGVWIWLESYLVLEKWGAKRDYMYDHFNVGQVTSSFKCEWRHVEDTLPEDPDYQKYLDKNSKLHGVLK